MVLRVCVLEGVFVKRRVSAESGRRESFDSHCYCLAMMQSTTRSHLEAAPRADGHSTYWMYRHWTDHSSRALKDKTQRRRDGYID